MSLAKSLLRFAEATERKFLLETFAVCEKSDCYHVSLHVFRAYAGMASLRVKRKILFWPILALHVASSTPSHPGNIIPIGSHSRVSVGTSDGGSPCYTPPFQGALLMGRGYNE